MKLVQFYAFGRHAFGELLGDAIQVFDGNPFEGELVPTGKALPLEVAHLLPASRPSKIVCVGSNYRAHCEEMGRPVPDVPKLFLKPPSALLAHGEPILAPPDVGRIDFEGELAVVIGRRMKAVAPHDALRHVLGYSVLNDVTARALQTADVQFTRGKGLDTFCPLGPVVETALQGSADDLRLITRVNGEVRQDGRTADMVFSVPVLLAFISRYMTLEPGDVIATGTPAGVGPIAPGDVVTVEIEGISTLENPVAAAPAVGEVLR